MKQLICLLIVVTSVFQIQSQNTTKPNILFIAIDDLKPTLACYGDTYAITPNINKITENAAVFLNNHTQQAVCGPSRASLMTGKRPDYTKVRDLKTKMRDINPDILTIPQYFKENGYITAGTGKIYDPRCVDEFRDKPSWSIPYISENDIPYPAEYGKPVSGYYQNAEIKKKYAELEEKAKNEGIKNLRSYVINNYKPPFEISDVPDEAYTDGAIAAHALKLLDDVTNSDKPFFLAVGFKRPHLPFVASKKYWDLYNRDEFQLAPYQKKAKNGTDLAYHNSGELCSYKDPSIEYIINKEDLLALDDDVQRTLIHGYYACTSFVDVQVGKIIEKLKEKGLDKNTIIVVWGDHGWHLGDHSLWNKHTNLEQATRSPFIVYSPFINKPVEITSPTEFLDIFPTLCEMSNLAIPENLDGKSLLPLLNGDEKKVKDFAVSQQPRGKITGYSFRSEKYRYTVWLKDDKKSTDKITSNDIVAEELYDYIKDPLETVNHFGEAKYKAVQSELIAFSEAFFKDEYKKNSEKKTLIKTSASKSIKELVKENYPSNNVIIGATLGDKELGTNVEKLFLKDFNYSTSRNFAKQTYIHPEPDVWRWDKIDEFIAFGKKNNIDLRFHSPISPQASKWAMTDSRTAKELEKNMTEFMTALCKKINNVATIKWMDVVNETVERNGEWFKDKPGVKEWENPWVKIGYNKDSIPLYILKAFEISNKYAPNISQVYNQHGGMEPVMWEKVKKTILYLKDKGYKIDGLGWQGHLKENSRVVDDPKNLKYLSELIDWAHANNLDFHITEFDYHLKPGENTPENYLKQADAYTKILAVLLEKSKTGLVTFNTWGITDLDDGKNTHRFIYDENLKPKPAYFAIKDELIKCKE
ncbi:hypothetical protein EC396_17380 [Lutibacter sp. HS1-25]|uniref:sulfatase-like hydrolase/transferase n=1 Tax=Lutibacter sp. HS1-25 TaxID=2485000 RepID=UPI001011B26C|nr:sulfatase-like hydrolase/transferase [Lutibacter sp. HS1-25]RXP44529.1 hypothetical protein EC396_17380 [Lutibacter sp. HS1-25]